MNEGNIRTLTKELLDYLNVCDVEFKPDLTNKICMLVQRFAPDKRWYIDSLVQVLSQAGPYVKPEACRSLLVLIMNASQLHSYAVRAFFRALGSYRDTTALSLLTTATWIIGEGWCATLLRLLPCWWQLHAVTYLAKLSSMLAYLPLCAGEYGELLLSSSGSKLLEGEPPLSATEAEVVDLLQGMLLRPDLGLEGREYALTALMKLAARFPGSAGRIKALIDQQTTSLQLEVQSRSVEFSRLFNFEAIRPQVMEHIPPLEESAYDASLEPAEPSTAAAAEQPAAGAAADLAALLGLDAPAPSGSAPVGLVPAAAPASSVSALQDLLAGDLLGNGSAVAAVPAPALAVAADPLADLLGGGGAPAPASTSAPAPSFTAYQRGGVTITFSLSKPAGPESTDVLATYTSSLPQPLTNFTMQAAVPKFMQLRLDPASSAVLPASGQGSITQKLHILNTMHGTKAMVLRIRLSYTGTTGDSVVEQAEVSFPQGS